MTTATPTTQRTRVKTAGQGMTFDAVSMHFPDGTHAVDDVSFSIGPGEFVSVVGPSGCGKSTLLKMASGLLPATGGEVTVDRGGLGYVFQDATLLPWRTVQKNVEFLGELEGMGKAERRAAAKEAIELVGLKGFEDKYPISLSGGMKMRASLARVLTLGPGTFLFDEPFGALDEITRERLNDELLQLFARTQFAGLFITHSIAEAVYMSTRVLVMSARPGRIIGDYPVEFPYPREPELRFDPAFAELCGRVSESLREAHA
ncbi:MAG: ABC transporter ATP-binding protein [Patulibacter minatonensis]